MIIYDQTSIAFIKRSEQMLREILTDIGFEVKTKRFVHKNHLYPISVVVYEGGADLGHFNLNYYQIALNRKLIYLAKDSVLRDILKHELAHYLTFIQCGSVQPHGPEFKQTCREFGFPDEVALASMNLEQANLDKVGDLNSERIIEKVKKLLQLAESSNAHESELATLKANALLLRHNLDHLEMKNDDEPIYLERVLIQKRKDAKTSAVYDMLKHFFVKPVVSNGKNFCCLEVSGSLTNVKLAVYVASFLEREFEHLWNQAKREHGLQGLRAKNSFFLGLAKGFDQKMKESKSQLSASDRSSLMVVEKNLDEKSKIIYQKLSFTRTANNLDHHAGELGIQKGKNISIRQGVETSAKGLYLSHLK